MANRRSLGILEAKIARNYCYEHSETKHRNNNPDEITERIYTGTAEEIEGAVLAELQDNRTGLIPEYPQGLVISDSIKQGFFNLVPIKKEVKKASCPKNCVFPCYSCSFIVLPQYYSNTFISNRSQKR